MKITTSILVAFVCIAAVADAKKKEPTPPEPTPVIHDDKNMEYYFTITRGVFEGLFRGYYKEYKFDLDERCMGNDTVTAIHNFEEIISSNKFLDWYNFMTDIYIVGSYTDRYCNI